ncbi:hypothetical protein Bca101_020148 [Brassica carinata]
MKLEEDQAVGRVHDELVMSKESDEPTLHHMRAMIQSLCVPYIAGKAQRLIGQSLGLGGSTLFPLQGFVPKGFPCKVFNEGVLQGSKLDLGSPKSQA